MKKLVLLFAAVLFTAISANVFAQDGSGTAPSIGSTHQYYVNGTWGTPSSGAENTYYTWWISTTPADLTTRTTLTSHFSQSDGAAYDTQTKGDVGGTGIELQWTATADVSQIYYLVVQETDVDGTACSNMKAIAIQPANNFDVIFAAVNGAATDADNPERCAPDIAISATGTTIAYNYGSDEYIYKVTSAGLYTDWTFNYAFSNTIGSATPTVEYSTDGSSYTTTSDSGSKTVTPTTGAATVYFRVSLSNGTAEEGLTAQSMVLDLTNISDGSNAPAHIYMSDGVTEFTGDIEQTQTVTARPATTGIGTDN